MPLQTFIFPLPETRFFKAGRFIYKFQIRGGSSFKGEERIGGSCLNQELEEIIRTVLGNLDRLQPFSTSHFNVFPYQRRWKRSSKVTSRLNMDNLRAYPFLLILHLEKNVQNGNPAEELSRMEIEWDYPSISEPQPKRRKSNSPLEEAILQDLTEEFDAEVDMLRMDLDNPHTEKNVEEDPGHFSKKSALVLSASTEKTSAFDESSCESDDKFRANPEEEPAGRGDPKSDEEESDGDEEESDGDEEEPRPGFLTRLARFFRIL